MAKNDSCPQGPNESIFKPGNATKMPTKHYPASGKLGAHTGKGTTIDGPNKGLHNK